MSDDEIVTAIFAREKPDYTDYDVPTKFGVTLATLERYRGQPCTADDVKALEEPEARAIAKKLYIVDPHFDLLTERLRWPVVDAGYNLGTATATKVLQRALGLPDDGVLGPATLAAVASRPQINVLVRFCAEWARQYGRIIRSKPANATYALGWEDRVADHLDEEFQ